MTTAISAAMLAECRGLNRTHWVAKLTSGATVLMYASDAVSSDSAGPYTRKIESWSEIGSDLGDDSYGLIEARASFVFFDEDRSFQNLLAQSAGGTLYEFDIEVWVVSDHVDVGDHYRRLLGKVKDYRLVGDRLYEVVYGPDDAQFQEPLRFTEINKAEHQVAFGAGGGDTVPDEAVGNQTQIIYNVHSSIGTEFNGMIPASYMATFGTTNYWFASWGQIADVPRIWNGDTLQTGDFTVANLYTTSGKVYTVLQADESDVPSTATVRFDASGITEDNLASGTLLTNPITILRHILTNFVFQEWAGPVDWLSESGLPFNTARLDADADFCDVHGIEASAVFVSGAQGVDVVNAFGSALRMNVFWTTAYEFATLIDDYGVRDTYLTPDVHIRQDAGHFLPGTQLEGNSGGDRQTRDVIVNSVFSGSSSARRRRVSVEKLTRQSTLNITIGKASLA